MAASAFFRYLLPVGMQTVYQYGRANASGFFLFPEKAEKRGHYFAKSWQIMQKSGSHPRFSLFERRKNLFLKQRLPIL
jgi:hypothetical protein